MRNVFIKIYCLELNKKEKHLFEIDLSSSGLDLKEIFEFVASRYRIWKIITWKYWEIFQVKNIDFDLY